jgi:hypothetical protein
VFPSNLVRLLDSWAFEVHGHKGIVRYAHKARILRSSENMVLEKMIEVEDGSVSIYFVFVFPSTTGTII